MGHLGVIATSVGVQKIFCSVVRSNKYVFGRCLEEMLFSSWNTMVFEMKPDTESLSGWNDALDYLFHLPPAESCEEAQNQLLMALHRDQGRRAT